jgi:hypothetical protein
MLPTSSGVRCRHKSLLLIGLVALSHSSVLDRYVYMVDRLTRSLADFAKLVELFDKHEGRCHVIENWTRLLCSYNHAATTSRHVCRADVLKARCVLAEVRWRWTLKVFCVAACTERNLCADPTLLNPCILRSLRRVG